MPAPKNIFVTGATGFLGSHLAHRLLEQGHSVIAIARASKNASARDRVVETLADVAGTRALPETQMKRLAVVEGDLAEPGFRMDPVLLGSLAAEVDEVWHCAASLSFTEEDRDSIFKMNVDGTRHILAFVARTPRKRFQHVSTAYVAGLRESALESELDMGQSFRNAYEESKCRAETIVGEAHAKGAVVASIYRPSVVIGDSRTGRATHFHGVYAFIRGLWSAMERKRRKAEGTTSIHLPMRVPGTATKTLNFVPVDYVVDGMLTISEQHSSAGGTYHLTNPRPTENGLWLPNICRLIGIEGIRFIAEDAAGEAPPTRLEALFQKQMAFYYMYLQGEPRFDCRRTLDALRNTGIDCPPVTVAFIEHMVGWYLEFLRNDAPAPARA